MIITAPDVAAAFNTLTPAEQDAVLMSDTVPNSRSGLTKLSAALLARLLNQPEFASPLTLHASFRGNAHGRHGGAAGALTHVSDFVKQQCQQNGLTFDENEILVDFLVTSADVLDVRVAVESEARPIASPNDLEDFDKLLLVSSPIKVFVSRVNVTSTGRTHKVEQACEAINRRIECAINSHHLAEDGELHVVLIQTTSTRQHTAYIGRLANRVVALVPLNF